jgi:DNA repair exonuclease SbcCD ATPase subunit
MTIAGAVIDSLARVAHQALMLWETVKLVANGIGMIVEQTTAFAQSIGQVLSGQISVGQALEKQTDLFRARANDIKKNVEGIWNNAKASGESFMESFKRQMANVTVGTRKELNVQGNAWENTYENVKNTVGKKLEDVTKKMEDVTKKMETENKNFIRSMEQATSAFNNKMKDLVIKHREAANRLRTDIANLTRDYNDSQLERASEHEERVQEIKNASNEEIETLRRNILLHMSESHRSDEDLKAMLEAQIAEREKKRDEEIAKEEARFAKETEKQKKRYEQRLKELQEKLAAEMEIQKKHQAEFDAIKDQAAEDDITRLKNEFAAEMELRRQQHAERMEELKKEYAEIQRVKASGDASIGSRNAINQTTPTIPKSTSATYKPSSSSALSSYNTVAAATGGKTLNLTQNNTVNNVGDISAMMNSIGWLFKGL